jgi:hypothetical protein
MRIDRAKSRNAYIIDRLLLGVLLAAFDVVHTLLLLCLDNSTQKVFM